MFVSLIIAVYKDVEALEIIFDSLVYQTYKNFEVIVAEDGNSKVMKDFVNKATKKYDLKIIHTTQEDLGVRKSVSQNRAIRASNGDYLIFIDGDCVLYSTFIENHIKLSCKKCVVTGRRVNLGPKYSKLFRDKYINSQELEKNFLKEYLKIKEDAKEERHSEEGFYIKPNGFLHKILKLRKKEFKLLGCNMSFYKKAIISINGFDEELLNAAVASDTDLEWRFKAAGYKIIPGRFMINQFHLYHKRSPEDYERGLVQKMVENQKNNRYICKEGIKKL